MPSRSPRTGRRLSPLVLIQDDQVLDDDLDVEVNYSDEEEGSEAEGSEEEEQDEGSSEEESVGEGCGAAVRARVSCGAAERPNMPTCPVCMEAWTAEGAHRISCIPCGHVYGRSCLEKWLTQRGNSSATIVPSLVLFFSALNVEEGLNISTLSVSMHQRLLFQIMILKSKYCI